MTTPRANPGSTGTAETAAVVAALLRGEAASVGGWDLALEGGAAERGLHGRPGVAWLVGGIDEVAARVGGEVGAVPGAVRRLMRKLTPGPLVVRFAPPDAGRVPRVALGEDGLVAVASPESRELMAVLDGVGAGGPGRAVVGVGGVEGSGNVKASTVVSVVKTPMGVAARVDRVGAYEERFVRKQLERRILFVCTGNTCRSPMAEAIATELIERKGLGGTLHASSAGTSASSGEPTSHEVAGALESIGLRSPGRGGSRGLTTRMLDEADAVYVMTRSHRQAVLGMSPRSGEKVHLLDPQGADVPDPIGQGPEVYSATARRLMELITARLEELDA